MSNISRWAAALSVLAVVGACSEDTQDDKEWVDPRYVAEDSYTVAADGSETVEFQVRSNMAWEVYNANPDWCTITPASGDADLVDATTVTVTYSNYAEIDDRYDTISLKSDYWVFKEIAVTQKGIAKLDLEDAGLELPEYDLSGSTGNTFNVIVNQNWTVSTDVDWLNFTFATSGTISDKVSQTVAITYDIEENLGELRSGSIFLSDRNGVVQQTLAVTQGGVILMAKNANDVETYEFRYECATTDVTTTIYVESNSEWLVKKSDSSVNWYYFLDAGGNKVSETSVVDGDGSFTLWVDTKAVPGVSAAAISLETAPAEGFETITKTIVIKQGGERTTSTYNFNDASWTWVLYVGSLPTYDATTGAAFFTCTSTTYSRIAMYNGSNDLYYGLYEVTIDAGSVDTTAETHLMLGPGTDGASEDNTLNIEFSYGKIEAGFSSSESEFSRALTDDEIANAATLGIRVFQSFDTGYLGYQYFFNGECILDCSEPNANDTNTMLNDVNPDLELYSLVLGLRYGDFTVNVPSWSYTAELDWDVEP